MRSLALVVAAASLLGRAAYAEESAAAAPPPATVNPVPTGNSVRSDERIGPQRDANTGVRDGTFLPQTFSARVGDQRVMGLAMGGYDTTAGQGALFQTIVEGAIVNRVAIRAGVEYTPAAGRFSPSVGVRVGLLRQERFGVDFGLGAFYKNSGFTEEKGEFEFVAMLARRWNRIALFANLIYGQGLAQTERDGELRIALMAQVHPMVHVGLDTRARFDLGEETPARMASGLEANFDLIAGPVAAVTVGHFVFQAQAGGRVVVVAEQPRGGFAAMGGAGAMF
ncbi:MAG: hypothetical protein JWN44_5796 [Myxococcales bacterium]|nr:hypothetical protein [Myxococcales bacterium]